ncbi:MAG: aldo/keto reductase [Okeania sp. SIO3B3]|nr:aldo/keto reductase [Okeania sp. SIO3B3]
MQYVENIPGIRSSRLGFGCAPVMGKVGKANSLRAMAHAYEHGINHFDVARSYGFGEAESALGEFARGKRDKMVIVTKFGIRPGNISPVKKLLKPVVRALYSRLSFIKKAVSNQSSSMLPQGFYSPAEARESLETSLAQLGTDYVDYLLIHEPAPDAELAPDLFDTLDALVTEGKVRAWGVSTWADWACDTLKQCQGRPQIMQYDANVFTPTPQCELTGPRMHTMPFGGVRNLELLRARADAPALASLLRDCGCTGQSGLARMLLAAALAQTQDATMTASMLKPVHIDANLAALESVATNATNVHMFAKRFPAVWHSLKEQA